MNDSTQQHSAENDVMRVGCPHCGASSNEPCWSDVFAHERLHPHPARVRFALTVIPPGGGENDGS